MKKSTIFGIACSMIAVVSVAIYLINKNKREEKHSVKKDVDEAPMQEEHNYTDIDLKQEKEYAASSIFERHNVAAQIIRDTLEEEESYDLNNSDNKIDFEEIDSSLDKLLDEE